MQPNTWKAELPVPELEPLAGCPLQDQNSEFTYALEDLTQKYREIRLNDISSSDTNTSYSSRVGTLQVYMGIDRYGHPEVIWMLKSNSHTDLLEMNLRLK